MICMLDQSRLHDHADMAWNHAVNVLLGTSTRQVVNRCLLFFTQQTVQLSEGRPWKVSEVLKRNMTGD